MSREKFELLVSKLEHYARSHPRIYKIRIISLAALAYAYLLGVLILLASLAIGSLLLLMAFANAGTIKLAFMVVLGCGALCLTIIKSLWVKFEPPEGAILNQTEDPEFFQFLNQVAKRLNSPRFHSALITGELNASVVQIPRLGIFGWHKNYLVVGLPLLQALSRDEFEAVLAHEFAHLSGGHSAFAGWVYRTRQTWINLFNQMAQNQQNGAGMFRAFLNWFFPYFNAYSFVLARENEFFADAASARLTSPETAARALVRLQVTDRHLNRAFWTKLYQQANFLPEAPRSTFVSLSETLQKGPPNSETTKWISEILRVQTGYSDTHPSLRDRLKALDISEKNARQLLESADASTNAQNAADSFLTKNTTARVQEFLQTQWNENIAPAWRERYQRAQQLRERLSELEQKFEHLPLTKEEFWELANLRWELKNPADARPLYERILALEPNHIGANYNLGRILLEEDNPAGVAYLEKAMDMEMQLIQPAHDLLWYFYRGRGEKEALGRIEDAIEKHSAKLVLAQKERASLTKKDVLLPHSLQPDELRPLTDMAAQFPRIREVYVVQKQLGHFPEKQHFAILVKISTMVTEAKQQKILKQLADKLQFPGSAMFYRASRPPIAVKRFKKVTNSLVYKR